MYWFEVNCIFLIQTQWFNLEMTENVPGTPMSEIRWSACASVLHHSPVLTSDMFLFAHIVEKPFLQILGILS